MMNRRQMLRLAGSGLILSGAYASPLAAAATKVKPRRVLAGLLLPLSGTNASVARVMERATTLAAPADPKYEAIPSFDTGGTPEGAAAAATAALKAGAGMILGPLSSAEVRPVLAAVGGQVPVLSFSNDPALLDSGAFLLGITPSQSVAAIFGYARGRGVRQVGVVVGDDGWSRAALAAAERSAPGAGLTLGPIVNAAGRDASALLAELRRSGDLPDAVLLPAGGVQMAALARMLKDQGAQILATVQTIAGSSTDSSAFDGAWLAGYDPELFGDFARSYQARHGGDPGLIAALAYDAANIARTLARNRTLSREGLLGTQFDGISGSLQFRSDGSCLRGLTILAADSSGNRMIGRGSAG